MFTLFIGAPMPATSLLRCVALALAVGAAAPVPGRAQQPSPPGCADDVHHAFDYWIGAWVVRDSTGTELGRNTITSVSDGCALLEEWESASGGSGRSLTFVERPTGEWRQVWIGGDGGALDLRGVPEDGVMVLSGDRQGRAGPVRDRVRWIPREDGKVEQLWESSTDEGATWSVVFRGFYEPRAG
jgi:hypothetical protein